MQSVTAVPMYLAEEPCCHSQYSVCAALQLSVLPAFCALSFIKVIAHTTFILSGFTLPNVIPEH